MHLEERINYLEGYRNVKFSRPVSSCSVSLLIGTLNEPLTHINKLRIYKIHHLIQKQIFAY